MNDKLEFWLINQNGDRMKIANCASTEDARRLWLAIAGYSVGMMLDGFEVSGPQGLVYVGNYVTDEC